MTDLTPADAQAIAWALAAILLPVNIVTLVWAMLWSFLMASKVAPPRFLKLYRKELNNPESEGAKAAKQNADQVADGILARVREEFRPLLGLEARLAPLLMEVEVEVDGKKVKHPQLIVALDELIEIANFVREAAIVDVVDADGKPAKGLLGPNLPHLMDNAAKKMADREKMKRVRGEDTSLIEEAMGDAEWAAENPEQAEALAAAHGGIESLAPVFNWDEKKKKQLHKQAVDAARAGENLKAWIDRLNRGGTALSQGGGSRGRGGGVEKLGL